MTPKAPKRSGRAGRISKLRTRPAFDEALYRRLVKASPLAQPVAETLAEIVVTARAAMVEIRMRTKLEDPKHRDACPHCGRAYGLTKEDTRSLAAISQRITAALDKLKLTKSSDEDTPGPQGGDGWGKWE